jgi:MFS family permease
VSRSDPLPPNVLPTTGALTDTSSTIDAAAIHAVQQRTLRVVLISQILGGAGLAAGVTVGALLAQQMLHDPGLTGAPAALFTLGSAAAAFLIGRLTQRWGRRVGLGLGFIFGGAGAIGVVVAATSHNIALLLASLFVYGAGSATNLQARYAGTDLADPTRRGSAISVSLAATTVGAVAGPNLVGPLGVLAAQLGMPALAGPFLLAAVAYLCAGAMFITLLRPDPFLLARAMASAQPLPDDHEQTAPGRLGIGAYVGALVMVVTQVAMISIMTMTPVHMSGHGHGLPAIGLVIGLHVAAMYLPSLITGPLVDRVGRPVMVVASGFTLLAAGVVAALAPGDSLGGLILALILLGLGWNFGLISGTALVVDATAPENRPKTQGTIDVLIAVAGAAAGAFSGIVMSSAGFGPLALAGGFLALVLLPALLWHNRRAVSQAAD